MQEEQPSKMQSKNNDDREYRMTLTDLRKKYYMSQRAFAAYFGIPRRTVENWDTGICKCPDYLLDLMKYKLEKEKGEPNETRL